MSHITTIKTKITNLDALRAALADMGLTLGAAGMVRYYFGGQQADHVVKLPGPYDIGFKQESDGSYSFVCDQECMRGTYSRGEEARKILGPNGGTLIQKYVGHLVPMLAGHQFTVQTEQNADGSVTYDLVQYN